MLIGYALLRRRAAAGSSPTPSAFFDLINTLPPDKKEELEAKLNENKDHQEQLAISSVLCRAAAPANGDAYDQFGANMFDTGKQLDQARRNGDTATVARLEPEYSKMQKKWDAMDPGQGTTVRQPAEKQAEPAVQSQEPPPAARPDVLTRTQKPPERSTATPVVETPPSSSEPVATGRESIIRQTKNLLHRVMGRSHICLSRPPDLLVLKYRHQ